jgi:hypothetical protein
VVGPRCVDWESGWLRKILHVRIGIVDSLERCLKYDFVDDCLHHRV